LFWWWSRPVRYTSTKRDRNVRNVQDRLFPPATLLIFFGSWKPPWFQSLPPHCCRFDFGTYSSQWRSLQ
jgi:hypothetical protein